MLIVWIVTTMITVTMQISKDTNIDCYYNNSNNDTIFDNIILHKFSRIVSADSTPANMHIHRNWQQLPGNEDLMEPKYTNFHYLNHVSPNAKIIIIIRDPVTR